MTSWLRKLPKPRELRVLYLAQYAPQPLLRSKLPYSQDGGYPSYHFNVYQSLVDLGITVYPSSQPSSLLSVGRRVDYVYSLLNRMPLRDSEVLVSAVCEYLDLPYLGAPPTVRAIAQDKLLFKLAAESLGIQTPPGKIYRPSERQPDPPTFSPPYFVKERGGAGSEGITERNFAPDWTGARQIISQILDAGKEVLLEKFCDGIDITVPVVGASPFQILPPIKLRSDVRGNILTHDLKLDDHLGFEVVSLSQDIVHAIAHDASKIWNALGAVDYFRIDYRFDPDLHSLYLLEINICCHFEEKSAISLAALQLGVTYPQLLEHILSYSLSRQRRRCEKLEWIL